MLIHSLRLFVAVTEPREPRVVNNENIPAFQWDLRLCEGKQVRLQRVSGEVFNGHAGETRSLLCTWEKSNLLDAADARFQFDLSDTAEMLIVKDLGNHTEGNLHHLPGLLVAIELEMSMAAQLEKTESQAIGKLLKSIGKFLPYHLLFC